VHVNAKFDRARRRDEPLRRIPPRLLLLIVITIGSLSYLTMIVRPSTSGFSPDSWSYYDLSQTVFADFYRPSVTRAFNERDGYSRSFPPLWPSLIAIADRLMRLGPKTGVVLAALLAVLTVIPIRMIVKACVLRRPLVPFATTAMWFGLLWFPPYWQESYMGCSIPLAVFLLSGAVACLVRKDFPVRPRWAAGAGLLLGLACMARFDSLAFAGLVVLASSAAPSIRMPAKASMVLAFLTAISPWALYSQTHYGTLWASDNSAVILSASQVRVSDYDVPADTLATNPARWTRRVAVNAAKLGLALVHAAGINPILPLSVAAAAIVSMLSRRRRTCRGEQPLGRLLLLTVGAAGGLAPQLLTGYLDRRYFSFFGLLAAGCAVCFVISRTSAVRVTVALGLCFLLLLSPLGVIEWGRQEFAGHQSLRLSADLRRQLLAEYHSARVLADSLCFEMGAVTRIQTICLPSDWERLSQERRREFVSSLDITHALVPGREPGQFSIEPIRMDLSLPTR
jgi:hypothetical protein